MNMTNIPTPDGDPEVWVNPRSVALVIDDGPERSVIILAGQAYNDGIPCTLAAHDAAILLSGDG